MDVGPEHQVKGTDTGCQGREGKFCSYTCRRRAASGGHGLSCLCRLPTQAYPSQTPPNTNFPLSKYPAQGPRFHLGWPVGTGVIPAVGLVLATLLRLPSRQEQLSVVTRVYHICACLGDSDVPARWQDSPGLEGASMRVGQQAWFWLGRKAGSCPV